MVPEPNARYYYTNREQDETPTVDRKNLKQGIFRSVIYSKDKKNQMQLFSVLRFSSSLPSNSGNDKSCDLSIGWFLQRG